MEILEKISSFVLPCVVLFIGLILLFGKGDFFSHFLDGARDGMKSAIRLLPSMCALVVGVSMFTASGAADFLAKLLAPVLDFIGIPSDIFPLVITRPLSGAASIATYEDIIAKTGADSFSSLCASVIMASSDTVFYVLCVYFSSSGVKKTRYALPVALFISAFAVVFSCVLCRIFF